MVTRAVLCSLILVFIHPIEGDIEKPPEITKPTKRTDYIKGTTNETLLCEGGGSPPAKYRWTFNGKDIPSSSTEKAFDPSTGTLKIIGFGENDQGTYQCFAENVVNGNKAVAMSSLVKLYKASLEGEPIDPPDNLPTATEGDYVAITCENQLPSKPPARYSWYLGVNSGQVKENNRIFVDNKGTLHFISVRDEDKSGTVKYKCGLRNTVSDNIILVGAKSLNVQKPAAGTAIPQSGAKNKYATNSEEFLLSKDAELECVFSGDPIPTITWLDKTKKEIPVLKTDKYEITNFGRKLTVKNLEEKDEGDYTCRGSNGVKEEDTTVPLDIISGPIWVESIKTQTIPAGRDAVFRCDARTLRNENPLSDPIWYKNGDEIKDISGFNGKLEYSDAGKTLIVRNVNKKEDIMCLQCKVSNEHGEEFGDGCLNVIEPIIVVTEPELEQKVKRGDIIDLTVIGTTDPGLELSYRWEFNSSDGKLINAKPKHITVNKNNHSYINTSTLSDDDLAEVMGTYHRILYHKYENKTVTIQVDPDSPVLPVVVPVGNAMIGTIIGICLALLILILVVIIIICVCRRKNEEGQCRLGKKELAKGMDPEAELASSGFQNLAKVPLDDDEPVPKSAVVNPSYDHRDEDSLDDGELEEYGGNEFDATKFKEDGSFIGAYTTPGTVPTGHDGRETNI